MANRCSYCYEEGHNRNKCPQMKKEYDNAIKLSDEDKSYSDRRVIREYETIQRYKKRMAENAKNRSCSFCGKTGHNRTTCPDKIKLTDLHQKAINIAHNIYVETIERTGQFIGSLANVQLRDNNVPFVLSSVPYPQPLILLMAMKNADQWEIESYYSDRQKEKSIEFYNSYEYKKLCDLAYIKQCQYKNIRLLSTDKYYYKLPYGHRTFTLGTNEIKSWQTTVAPDISPEYVWRKLISKYPNSPFYNTTKKKRYKPKNNWKNGSLSSLFATVPALDDSGNYRNQFDVAVMGDFMTNPTGHFSIRSSEIYTKDKTFKDRTETLLRHYIEALSDNYLNKYFKIK